MTRHIYNESIIQGLDHRSNGAPCFDWSLGLVLGGWPSKIKVIWLPGIHRLRCETPNVSTRDLYISFTKPYPYTRHWKRKKGGTAWPTTTGVIYTQTDMTMEFNNHLKMYLLLNKWWFPASHVSSLEVTLLEMFSTWRILAGVFGRNELPSCSHVEQKEDTITSSA